MSAALKPDSFSSPAESIEDRRRHARMDYRTAVLAIVDGPDGLHCLRCQSDDLFVRRGAPGLLRAAAFSRPVSTDLNARTG